MKRPEQNKQQRLSFIFPRLDFDSTALLPNAFVTKSSQRIFMTSQVLIKVTPCSGYIRNNFHATFVFIASSGMKVFCQLLYRVSYNPDTP